MNWMTNSIHFLLIALTLITSHSMFFSAVSILPALVICFIFTFVTHLQWRKGFVLIYVLLIVVGYRHFINDLFQTINALAQLLATIGIYLNPLALETVPMLYDGLFFSSIALLMTSFLLLALQKKSGFTLLLSAGLIWSLQMIFAVQPSLFINSLYFGAVLINLLYMKKTTMPVYKTIFALPILLSSLMIISAFFMQEELQQGNNRVKEVIINKVADLRYQSGPLSDGNLLAISAFQPTEQTALKIVMEEPMPLYLKGFVGSQYNASSWGKGDIANYLAHKPLLDALQQKQFTSSQQLYLAALEGLGEQKSANMTVQNIAASSRYFYTPYELKELHTDSLKVTDYSMLETAKFFGERTYRLTYMQTAINNYPKIANSLYKLQTAPYLNQESYYNQYVYSQYLQLPAETRSLLLHHVGENFDEMEQLSYEQAIQHVTSAMNELLQYREDIVQAKTNNFLMSLLEETREGYSIHYATVGTLLFRTLGIPARYVEGYLVTPDDIQQAESYSEIAISEKNAHAWTEIYIDMVGWIPIELTPPYQEIMPPVNVTDYPEAAVKNAAQATASASVEGQAQQVQDDPNLPDTSEPLNETVFSFLYIVVAILLLILLLALYYIYKLLKAKKRQQQLDYREGVISSFTRLLNMLNNEGLFLEQRVTDLPSSVATQIAPHLEETMQLAVESYQRAMYSPSVPTAQEQQNVQQLHNTIRQLLVQSKKRRVKWAFLWRYYIKAYFTIK